MLSKAKYPAQGHGKCSRVHCEILHSVQDDMNAGITNL